MCASETGLDQAMNVLLHGYCCEFYFTTDEREVFINARPITLSKVSPLLSALSTCCYSLLISAFLLLSCWSLVLFLCFLLFLSPLVLTICAVVVCCRSLVQRSEQIWIIW
jgi:hypothetical protein